MFHSLVHNMPRNIFRKLALGCSVVLALSVSIYVESHHAFSAEFDANRPFQVQGVIVKVEWINPHSWLHVDIKSDDGSVVPWMMEMGTPNTLLRRGLTRKVLIPGEEVSIRGYQSKDVDCDPKCRGSGRDITFADGSSAFMGSSGTGAPKDGSDPSER